MSDWIEHDGRKYYEESYITLANKNAERRGERIAELEARELTPAGWLYKVIVNKHVTGPPLPGQIKIEGVWGTPSGHLHFSPTPPTDRWIYWKAPVYFADAPAEARPTRTRHDKPASAEPGGAGL